MSIAGGGEHCARMAEAQVAYVVSVVSVGEPKSHTAAGLYFWIKGREAGREAPQVRKPMPIGRMVLSGGVVGKGLALRRETASSRRDSRSDTS